MITYSVWIIKCWLPSKSTECADQRGVVEQCYQLFCYRQDVKYQVVNSECSFLFQQKSSFVTVFDFWICICVICHNLLCKTLDKKRVGRKLKEGNFRGKKAEIN